MHITKTERESQGASESAAQRKLKLSSVFLLEPLLTIVTMEKSISPSCNQEVLLKNRFEKQYAQMGSTFSQSQGKIILQRKKFIGRSETLLLLRMSKMPQLFLL